MKTNHFAKLFFLPVVLILLFTAFSCDQAEDPTNYQNGDYGSTTTYASTTTTLPVDASKSLSFNNRNGKAVASIDPASDNHLYRATTPVASTLAKILEDGTLESFFILDGDATVDSWPEVEFMVKAPNSGELYVYFKDFIVIKKPGEVYGMAIGQFFCIKEDGSFFDILKKEDGSWYLFNTFSEYDPITFDKFGNMYYIRTDVVEAPSTGTTISGEGTTTTTLYPTSFIYKNAIYKFDPTTNSAIQMTENIENLQYGKFFVSNDGEYLFAEAFVKNSPELQSSYLRAIPINNPSNYKNIFSISNSDDGFVQSFTASPATNTVYYSGSELGAENLSGIFSATSADYETSTHDIHSRYNTYVAFTGRSILDPTLDMVDLTVSYVWTQGGNVDLVNVSFINEDGSLNSANMLAFLRSYIPYPNAVFSLKTLNATAGLNMTDDTITNEAALSALTSEHLQLIFSAYFTEGKDPNQFLIDVFGISPTDIGISIKYSSQLSVASDGSVWGTTLDKDWKESFIKLYDTTGKPSIYAPTALKDGGFIPIKLQMGEGYIYFSCAIPSSEYHTIKCVSLADPDTLIDVFVNVPNNTTIKISDYSISGDTLYFSGLKAGTTAISGKIDLTGQAFTFTEVAEGFKINKILAY